MRSLPYLKVRDSESARAPETPRIPSLPYDLAQRGPRSVPDESGSARCLSRRPDEHRVTHTTVAPVSTSRSNSRRRNSTLTSLRHQGDRIAGPRVHHTFARGFALPSFDRMGVAIDRHPSADARALWEPSCLADTAGHDRRLDTCGTLASPSPHASAAGTSGQDSRAAISDGSLSCEAMSSTAVAR